MRVRGEGGRYKEREREKEAIIARVSLSPDVDEWLKFHVNATKNSNTT